MTDTTDPTRLLEDQTELSEDEQRLLLAGRDMAPPDTLSASLWVGLATKLPPSPAPGASGTPGASGLRAGGGVAGAHASGLGLLLFKAALVAGTLGALVIGGRAWWRAHAAAEGRPKDTAMLPAAPALLTPSAAASLAPAGGVPTIPTAPERLPAHVPNMVRSGKTSERSPVPAASSDAREESRVVTAARSALRSGDSAGALGLLAQAKQRFGSGVLGQEREALLIEALSKSGQVAAARAHGQAFLKSYANSPYAARVQQIVGPDQPTH